MTVTWKVPLLMASPDESVKSWNEKLNVPSELTSVDGRVNVSCCGPAGAFSQVSMTVMEVPAAAVPSNWGDVLLVTGTLLTVA